VNAFFEQLDKRYGYISEGGSLRSPDAFAIDIRGDDDGSFVPDVELKGAILFNDDQSFNGHELLKLSQYLGEVARQILTEERETLPRAINLAVQHTLTARGFK